MAVPVPITVGCVGPAGPSPDRLEAALCTLTTGVQWRVHAVDTLLPDTSVDIVLCDVAAAVGIAVRQWPAAAIVAVVPARDDGAAVIAALDAGALICVRDDDVALTAAYVQSVARRRGLLIGGTR
jgi:hypothetical protein